MTVLFRHLHRDTEKFPDIVKLHTCLLFFDLLCDRKPSSFVINYLLYQNNIAIPLAMSLYDNNYDIFPFTEQTSESSLPLLLDIIFGMIFPFPSALGILKKLFKYSLFGHYLSQY